MNKQQLGARLWRMANKMRGKTEAYAYKDFILGFIFYRFLSESELKFLRDEGWEEDEIEELDGSNEEDVAYIRDNHGYFISYKSLYSTWVDPNQDFDIDNVYAALNAFPLNISKRYEHVFDKVFDTLRTSLSNLGDNAAKQTKAVSDILELIKPIPMSGDDNYDQIGFIYEYLISQFSANAGKKAGEFYTPHEVATLMSDIVAYELRDRDEISIYDPTSGSASLLLNIGTAIARRNGNPDSIKYYAQELIAATYNLTRMNLVMKGVKPANIVTRNADTLDEDWPLLSDSDEPLRVDACVSNPPYSQPWDNRERNGDARFDGYGIAPKSKADYAFLLHNLYHMLPHGVMCIVLPHGVLFRGGEEGEIRSHLIDEGKIYAVIGLPANIFFGTGIPTIVMVLKKERRDDKDVLFIDASKGFVKDGKKNRLRSSDIRRIFDAYVARTDIEGYAHLASKDEIVANGYNLNIPRYVDSSEQAEEWDLYASMFGGIPDVELDELSEYWDALPGLREDLFEDDGNYSHVRVEDIAHAVNEYPSTLAYVDMFDKAFLGFGDGLKSRLTDDVMAVNPVSDEDAVVADVFARSEGVPLVDRYAFYQMVDDQWQTIATDFEAIQSEGFHEAVSAVDAHMILKKSGDDEVEVQDTKVPWVGHVLPFELVQGCHFKDELAEITSHETRDAAIGSQLQEIFESLDEDERDGSNDYVKDSGDDFDAKGVDKAIDELYAVEEPEIASLVEYRALGTKPAVKEARLAYIASHPKVRWSAMRASAGNYSAQVVSRRIDELKEDIVVEEDSLLAKLLRVQALIAERKVEAKQAKDMAKELHLATKDFIEAIDDDTAMSLLRAKWVDALTEQFEAVPTNIISELVVKLEHLAGKYAVTFAEVGTQIADTKNELVSVMGRLRGNEFDMAGVRELMTLLGGE